MSMDVNSPEAAEWSRLMKQSSEQEHRIAVLRDDLSQSLRQWRMYAEQQDSMDLDHDNSTEAMLYRQILARLNG